MACDGQDVCAQLQYVCHAATHLGLCLCRYVFIVLRADDNGEGAMPCHACDRLDISCS
jgi:hypothetical protein